MLILDNKNNIIRIDIKSHKRQIARSLKRPINKCFKISDELFGLESNSNSIMILSFSSLKLIKEYKNMQCSLFFCLNDNHFRILVENNNTLYLLNKHNGTIKGVLRLSKDSANKNLFLYDETHLGTVSEK